MAIAHRARGVLKIKRRKTVSAVGRANAMCVGIDENTALFPSPPVTTSIIQTQVGARSSIIWSTDEPVAHLGFLFPRISPSCTHPARIVLSRRRRPGALARRPGCFILNPVLGVQEDQDERE
jgi:hypothetical protein